MRLNQFLASAGFGSRRACEKLIVEGRVTIDGRVVVQLATRVGEGQDVRVNGKAIAQQKSFTIALYKPTGVICSTVGEKPDRQTVFDLLPKKFPRLFYVGRLDVDSEGLMILTNQGELAQKLTHPRYKLPKTYDVRLDQPFDMGLTPKLLKGFLIEPGFAKMDAVYRKSPYQIKVVLTQGLKRQIRHMFYKLGYEVVSLRRTQIGKLGLDRLKPGEWRELNDRDFKLLQSKI